MASSVRRSDSASAAIATNSLPRWLISITDMPASCQLTSSHFAFSSTSIGIVAGPAPKLKMRAAGLMWCVGPVAVAVAAFACAAVPVFAIVVVTIHDGLQARELLALSQIDEGHALGGAAHLADLVHARADQHTARCDQHDLVLGRGERGGHDLAVALRGLDRDHALGAAAVARVFGDRRALAVAVLGGGEHALRLVLRHQQRDPLAALGEVHAADPTSSSTHRSHVVLVEAHGLALVGEQHHVVLAIGDRHTHEAISLVQVHRDDSRGARARVIGERGLLHYTLLGGEEHVAVLAELAHRQDRVD